MQQLSLRYECTNAVCNMAAILSRPQCALNEMVSMFCALARTVCYHNGQQNGYNGVINLSQCWLRSMPSYGVTRTQWVQQLIFKACRLNKLQRSQPLWRKVFILEMHLWNAFGIGTKGKKQKPGNCGNSAERDQRLIGPGEYHHESTKFEIKPISGLSVNVRKLFGQSEANKELQFSDARLKFNQTWAVLYWVHQKCDVWTNYQSLSYVPTTSVGGGQQW